MVVVVVAVALLILVLVVWWWCWGVVPVVAREPTGFTGLGAGGGDGGGGAGGWSWFPRCWVVEEGGCSGVWVGCFNVWGFGVVWWVWILLFGSGMETFWFGVDRFFQVGSTFFIFFANWFQNLKSDEI